MTQKVPKKFQKKNDPTEKCPKSSKNSGGEGLDVVWKIPKLKLHNFLGASLTRDGATTKTSLDFFL